MVLDAYALKVNSEYFSVPRDGGISTDQSEDDTWIVTFSRQLADLTTTGHTGPVYQLYRYLAHPGRCENSRNRKIQALDL